MTSARRRRPFIEEDPLAVVKLRQAHSVDRAAGADARFLRFIVGSNHLAYLRAIPFVQAAGPEVLLCNLFRFEYPRHVTAERMRDDVLGRDVLEARYLPAVGSLSY